MHTHSQAGTANLWGVLIAPPYCFVTALVWRNNLRRCTSAAAMAAEAAVHAVSAAVVHASSCSLELGPASSSSAAAVAATARAATAAA